MEFAAAIALVAVALVEPTLVLAVENVPAPPCVIDGEPHPFVEPADRELDIARVPGAEADQPPLEAAGLLAQIARLGAVHQSFLAQQLDSRLDALEARRKRDLQRIAVIAGRLRSSTRLRCGRRRGQR